MGWSCPSALRRILRVAASTALSLVFVVLCVGTYLEQTYRLHSRTVHTRQFTPKDKYWPLGLDVFRHFESQHAIFPERNGGLRVYIDEWPAWKYLISIQSLPDGSAKGAIRATPYDGKSSTYEREFRLEDYETGILLPTIDRKVAGFWGARSGCTDGTLFQFERWNAGRVTSGIGNAACQRHYAGLMEVLGETLIVNLRDAPFHWRGWFYGQRALELTGKGS